MTGELSRRAFNRLLAGGAFAALPSMGCTSRAARAPGSPIKISLQVPADFTDDDLTFARQLGVAYVSVPTRKGSYETFMSIKRRVEAAGLRVANIGNASVHNMPEVTLNLPGRDSKIAEYQEYLRNLGKAGISYTTYAHMGNGIWSSEAGSTRGGAPARTFDLSTAKGAWDGKIFDPPLTHGRVFTEDELWDNYTYFIRKVAPVAEECGVRMGIHPDDPPVPVLGGVPRCIFGSYDGYLRALRIANSPNVGVCLCCGTWMEGGQGMGKDVLGAIREFGALGKLWKIHFRNVSAPVPKFVETFVDGGYTDMKQVMRALVEARFDGILIADHVPQMVGGRNPGWAYSIGYIKALYQMALEGG
jgi:mannonate dehydratase